MPLTASMHSAAIASREPGQRVLKTAGLAAATLAATAATHTQITFGTTGRENPLGPPNLAIVFALFAVQVVLMVVGWHQVARWLPGRSNLGRGLVFAAFFLASTLVPSTLGLLGFEREWALFTPSALETWVGLFDDSLVFLMVGALLGVAFPVSQAQPLAKTGRLALAMVLCGLTFVAVLAGLEHLVFRSSGVSDPHAPVHTSLWFNAMFYGLFAMTGASLAALRALTRQLPSESWARHWLGTTGLFCLLWLPVQNFMVAFGWDARGGLLFSLVSIIPIALTIRLADRLLRPPTA